MTPKLALLAPLAFVLGCHAASADTMPPPAASTAAPQEAPAPKAAEPAPRVGTDPGHVGRGTPLAPAPGHELAAFAAGCFWGVEDAFRHVPGVTATAVGYTGGHTTDPTYEKVCRHDTGHAETVLVEYDPQKISYERLLAVFFAIHDPTTLNRQGPDLGDQYRSEIFTFSPAQEAAARAAIAREQAKLHQAVTTRVEPIGPFWKAEDYHQQYAERTGDHSCPIRDFGNVVAP